MIHNTISSDVQAMIEITRNNPYSDQERLKMYRRRKKEQSSPEFIDQYIYAIEHEFVRDGIVDWNGCTIDESWERYKESVGYYKRHPEREAESKAFTKEVMKWWTMHLQEETSQKNN